MIKDILAYIAWGAVWVVMMAYITFMTFLYFGMRLAGGIIYKIFGRR